MSMIAQFVQITPERLTQLVARPSSVAEPFETSAGDFSEFIGQELQRGEERLQQAATGGQLAKMLAASLDSLDPAMRQMLESHMGTQGVNVDGLKSSQGGESILRWMERRLSPSPRQSAPSSGSPAENMTLSLDKAWHGVHYLLCGEVEPGASLLSQAVLGGTQLGEDLGYGPARYFQADQVAEIAREMSSSDLEAGMESRYDSERMSRLGVYPGRWDR
jgi:hypothetical protein